MNKPLEFFYDYVSPYSYLADTQVRKLYPDAVYRPFFLGGVIKATANNPPLTVPAKFAYLKKDMARWVKRYRVDFVMNPNFPQNTVKALRLALVAEENGVFLPVHVDLFNAMWVHRQDLASDEFLAGVANKHGLPADTMLQIEEAAIKEKLRNNTDEAIGRGAFGAPTFFVGDQMFFGNDRFEFIAAELAG